MSIPERLTWIIHKWKEGIKTDMEVIDEPHKIAKGQDPSLEKVVEVLLKQLKENPPKK